MAKITSFVEGFTNTGRFPYVHPLLDCGHGVDVKMRATTGTCGGCGTTLSHEDGKSFERCTCGAWHTKNIDSPRPHNEADRLTKIGDVHECVKCAQNVEKIAWLRSLPKGAVHHARFDPRFSPGSYHLYRHDVTSPSGFFLMGSVPATKEFDAVLNEVRISPISPTEPA